MAVNQQLQAAWAPTDVTDQQEVNEWLEGLRLPCRAIDETIDRMVAAARECTSFDAPTRAGSEMWFVGVRVLREQLVRGDGIWTVVNRNNLPLVVSIDGIAIAISGGDATTGDPTRIPGTKWSKGPEWMRAIQGNQGVLPGMLPKFTPVTSQGRAQPISGNPTTWVLLVYWDEFTVSAELSRPAAFRLENDEVQVCGWDIRLILRRRGDDSRSAPRAQTVPSMPASTGGPIPRVELKEQPNDGTLQSQAADRRSNEEGVD